MKGKKGFLLGFMIMAFTLCACSTSESLVAKNTKSFSNTVKGQTGDNVMFNDLADFDWENAYVFVSYKSKEEMEEVIGFKSDEITASLDYEDAFSIVFTLGNQVVACVSGRPSSLGFDFDLGTVTNYKRIYKDQNNCEYSVSKNADIVTLTCLRKNAGPVIGGDCDNVVIYE